MKKYQFIAPCTAVILLSGCASNGLRTPNLTEVDSFEHEVQARYVQNQEHETLYAQAMNKSEDCKVPVTSEHMSRTNVKVFWDGACKDGYAYGLGRDIVLSDTHHVEAITVYDFSKTDKPGTTVYYDIGTQIASYFVVDAASDLKISEMHSYQTNMYSDVNFNGFMTYSQLGYKQDNNNGATYSYSPLQAGTATMVFKNGIGYRLDDNSSAPLLNPNAPVRAFSVVDAATSNFGPYLIYQYANGVVNHVFNNNGAQELVKLPMEFTKRLDASFNDANTKLNFARAKVKEAYILEKKYLEKACTPDSLAKAEKQGLPTNFCTWRDAFSEPLKNALASYEEQVKEQQRQAAELAIQRQDYAYKQQILQQQINAQQQAQSQQGFSDMIQCTKLGDLSPNKNIQTFKGVVCPIGWLPYNGW